MLNKTELKGGDAHVQTILMELTLFLCLIIDGSGPGSN